MRKKYPIIILALILFAVALLIQLDNIRLGGEWFDLYQIHHETFTIAFVIAGIVLLYLTSPYSIWKIA
jgi:hypothetical protein